MSYFRDKARLERIRRDIAEARENLIKIPKIQKKSVHFPSIHRLEQVKEVSPRRDFGSCAERKFQETVNRLMVQWIRSHGSEFQEKWMKKHPKLPHISDEDYEEQIANAMDREANKAALHYLEKQKLAELQKSQFFALGGGQNRWVSFVKEIQDQYGCTYKTALIEASKQWRL